MTVNFLLPRLGGLNIKKLIVILTVFNVLILSVFAMPNEANAMTGKVASKVAVKVAKELIIDSAVNEAMDIIFHYQMDSLLSEKYDVDEGYKSACLPKTDGSKDSKCTKPVQIKKTITAAEKASLGQKVEQVLDTKMGNTGWIKFFDWFVPLIGIGIGLKWLESQLDPASKNLFDEVAEQSLIDTEIIKNVKKKPTPTENGEPLPFPTGNETIPSGTTLAEYQNIAQTNEIIFSQHQATTSKVAMNGTYYDGIGVFALKSKIESADTNFGVTEFELNLGNSKIIVGNDVRIWARESGNSSLKYSGQTYVYKNGQQVQLYINGTYNSFNTVGLHGLNKNKITEVYAMPYKNYRGAAPGYRSTEYVDLSRDYLLNYYVIHTSDGDVYEYKSSFISYTLGSKVVPKAYVNLTHSTNLVGNVALQLGYFTDGTMSTEPYNPILPDIVLSSVDSSKYIDSTTDTVKLLPPDAIPISTPEGVNVKPSKDSSTGWINISDGSEISVDEETLIVSDPKRTPEGGGYETPEGEQIPDVEPRPEPVKDDAISETDFENLSCVKPEKPNFEPIEVSFTHAFPFSIPWDIERYIDTAFGGIDDVRPSFALSFLGDDVVIEIPAYFDKWVAFGKAIVIIGFDIGVLYLFYRFMKGGGE